MSEKEKAKELVDKMCLQYIHTDGFINAVDKYIAKMSAIICCDEIIKELKNVEVSYELEQQHPNTCLSKTNIPYWESIKVQIQSL
jgi:hypothetical protein